MIMGLITIAIASYNNARYIERCMESVCGQTYSDIEIILVDDGSTDDTLQRIEKFRSDKRLKVIQKDNGGLSSVRQRALDEATGEFICFIDADDYLSETYIETQLNSIINTDADISVCSTRFELSDGSYLPKESKEFACTGAKEALKLEAKFLNEGSFPYNITLSDSWNKLYRLSFLRRIGVEFSLPKGFNGTDTAFNWKVALFEPKYSLVEKEEYIHVIYNSSAVHRRKKKLYQGFKIITEQLIDTAKKHGHLELYRKAISRFYYNFTRMAVTDIARESEGLFDCRRSISSFIEEHQEFIAKNNIPDNPPCGSDSDYNVIFFLLSKIPSLLAYYLYIRTRFAKLKSVFKIC